VDQIFVGAADEGVPRQHVGTLPDLGAALPLATVVLGDDRARQALSRRDDRGAFPQLRQVELQAVLPGGGILAETAPEPPGGAQRSSQ
jgi:hypothetical protein